MSGRDDESCDIMRYHATEAEAGQERVVYDVIRPKALRKRDEAAGAEGEAEAVPLTVSLISSLTSTAQHFSVSWNSL